MSGIITGLILLLQFLWSLPDGKLHVTFCDVGQGDAIYIRFPDGRDMLIDGGPNDSVLRCLGRHMPFWDRTIDLVLLTHPESDHMTGLVPVLERFRIGYFMRSNVVKDSKGYEELLRTIQERHVPVRFLSAGDEVTVGPVRLAAVWPPAAELADSILGVSTGSVNDMTVVCHLRYGAFDVLLTGDAGISAEERYVDMVLADKRVEVLKVPHHGSKTGVSSDLLEGLKPQLAVISVGKNSFGHPAAEVLRTLADHGVTVLQTRMTGDIELFSDGVTWKVWTTRSELASRYERTFRLR